jgi:hypothetical protein
MHYGVFTIETDADGHEHVGRMVFNEHTYTAATGFVLRAYEAGQLPDGTPVPVNGLKVLELEARPWGAGDPGRNNPVRIKPGQVI